MRVELRGATNLASPEAAERALRRTLQMVDQAADEASACLLPSGEVLAMVSSHEGWLLVRARPESGTGQVEASGGPATSRLVQALRSAFQAEAVHVPGVEERFEEDEPGVPLRAAYPVESVLARLRTPHRELLLFETPVLGRVLSLGGAVQLTDVDAHVYHEVLAHPALFTHPEPRQVAIVGGADGHLLAEVLKHATVERAHVFEPDPDAVDACREHLETARRAFADPRVELHPGDVLDSVGRFQDELDVVLCDLPRDLHGAGAGPPLEPLYAGCRRALRGPGVLVAQSGSLHFHRETVRRCRRAMAVHFPTVALLWAAMATRPGGWWTFTLGSTGPDPRVVRRLPSAPARLYTAEAHEWFFVPDAVLQRLLG